MKFTFRQFTNKGIAIVGQTTGDWNSFADEAVRIWKLDNTSEGEKYPLAGLVEAMMDNYASDYEENKDSLKWEDFANGASSEILDCNAPFVYNGRNQQIMSFSDKAYHRIDKLILAECKAHFNEEEYKDPSTEVKAVKTSNRGKNVHQGAKGVYFRPTKKNPNRWAVYYRKDNQTLKLGYFNSEVEAIEARAKVVPTK